LATFSYHHYYNCLRLQQSPANTFTHKDSKRKQTHFLPNATIINTFYYSNPLVFKRFLEKPDTRNHHTHKAILASQQAQTFCTGHAHNPRTLGAALLLCLPPLFSRGLRALRLQSQLLPTQCQASLHKHFINLSYQTISPYLPS